MKNILITLFFYLSAYTLLAQPGFEPCYFDQYQRQNKTIIQNAEQIISNAIREKNSASRTTQIIKVIPVVVHVIHNGGVENISDVQIQSQIDVLNEDFRKASGTNGDGNGVDTEIEFCLAKLDPSGYCTNGIVRVQSTLTNHLTYQRSLLKQISYWDNTRYLNMYVVKSINGGSGIAGYASFPGGPPDEDGIVVRYNYFGRIGAIATSSNGRTTTHEISHWFGLYHTFNNGCGTDTCSDGDYICDTPPAANPNFGCPSVNSCTNDFPDVNDQIANYCDYSNDACKNMFTAGQKARMDATLNTFRTLIWDSANITATGCDSNFVPNPSCPPKANFVALVTSICTGGGIVFNSNTLNSPAALNWIFPGGTPASSMSANPSVVYNTVGTYDVTLIVSNLNGTDTLFIPNYITVNNPVAGSPTTWGDNFENGNFPTNGLTIDNPDGGITWERTTDAAREGIASVRIQNLINTNYGQSDALLIPRLDFTTFPTPINMAFRWAYARSDVNYSDEMIVLVSSDCGNTWTQKYYRTGSSLVTGPTQTTIFIPDSTQWKLASIDLTSYAVSDHVDIKIVNVTDGGNALYIDSLKVGDFDFNTLPSSISEVEKNSNWFIYPNPVESSLTISSLENNNHRISAIQIFNTLGEPIVSLENVLQSSYSLNTSKLANGVYFIRIKSGSSYYQQKFIKQ
ncbi:MAG: hypothetical protein RL065_1268 [Bacteroidota bacterium]|jgi:PKD repeat protein